MAHWGMQRDLRSLAQKRGMELDFSHQGKHNVQHHQNSILTESFPSFMPHTLIFGYILNACAAYGQDH
jgi:hypothetical protein